MEIYYTCDIHRGFNTIYVPGLEFQRDEEIKQRCSIFESMRKVHEIADNIGYSERIEHLEKIGEGINVYREARLTENGALPIPDLIDLLRQCDYSKIYLSSLGNLKYSVALPTIAKILTEYRYNVSSYTWDDFLKFAVFGNLSDLTNRVILIRGMFNFNCFLFNESMLVLSPREAIKRFFHEHEDLKIVMVSDITLREAYNCWRKSSEFKYYQETGINRIIFDDKLFDEIAKDCFEISIVSKQ